MQRERRRHGARHRSAACPPQAAEGFQKRGVPLNTDINIESVASVVSLNGKNLRLPLQAASHRRQRGRKDMSSLQIQRGLL